MKILRLSELVDVSWKNGGGVTRHIAHATTGAQTVWRLSRADVAQDGAFSNFPGLERILTVVSDTGMALHSDGQVLDARPWHPVRFSGGLDITARLTDGPLTDLNLMFDPTLCDGTVKTLRGVSRGLITPPAAGLAAIHVLAGQPELGAERLDVGDTAFLGAPLDTPANLTLGAQDAVLQIVVTYRDQSSVITLSIAAR